MMVVDFLQYIRFAWAEAQERADCIAFLKTR